MNGSLARGVVLACLLATVGCASLGGPSDREQIAGIVKDWCTGIETANLDLIMKHFADNYRDAQVTGKDNARVYMQELLNQGYFQNVNCDAGTMQTRVNGDSAVSGPLRLTSDKGQWSIDFFFRSEKGKWEIVSLNVHANPSQPVAPQGNTPSPNPNSVN